MAVTITLTPCDAFGNTVSRSVSYYAVEAPNPQSDVTTPHIKINYGQTGLETVTMVVQAEIRTGSGQTYYVDKLNIETLTIPANTDYIYAYPVTIDQILGFCPINFPSDLGDWLTEVKYYIILDGAQRTDTVSYVVSGYRAKYARERIGYPHLTDDTVLERGILNNGTWTQNPDGRFVKVTVGVVRPKHLALGVRARVEIIEKIGSTKYLRGSGTPAWISLCEYLETESTASGYTWATTELSNKCRVDVYVECNSPQDQNSWQTVEKVSKWISFLPPVFAANFFGNGISFGKLPSQAQNLFEVAQDWDVELNGDVDIGGTLTVSSASKTEMLKWIYPVGSVIFAPTANDMSNLINALPGTWTPYAGLAGYLKIPTNNGGTYTLYVATRTA